MKPDDTVCFCFHVTKRKVLNFLKVERPRRASQLSECGGAGTGCGWCVRVLVYYFEQAQAGRLRPDDPLDVGEHQRQRQVYLQARQQRAASGSPDRSPGVPDDQP